MITTSYGNWTTRIKPYNSTLEAEVAQALDTYNPTQTVLDAVCAAYREAINAALPPGVVLAGNEFYGPVDETDMEFDNYPIDDEAQLDLDAIVGDVDFWAVVGKILDIAPESKEYEVTLTYSTRAPGPWHAAQQFKEYLAGVKHYSVSVISETGVLSEVEL